MLAFNRYSITKKLLIVFISFGILVAALGGPCSLPDRSAIAAAKSARTSLHT